MTLEITAMTGVVILLVLAIWTSRIPKDEQNDTDDFDEK